MVIFSHLPFLPTLLLLLLSTVVGILPTANGNPPPSYYVPYDNVDITTCAAPCVRVLNCGYGTNETCDPSVIAQYCDADMECVAFNSNAWLKGCGNSTCGASFEPSQGTTTYIKHNGYYPPVPVPAIDDDWYPPERMYEYRTYIATIPNVTNRIGTTWVIMNISNTLYNVSQGMTVNNITLLSILSTDSSNPIIITEQIFSRWSIVSYLTLTTVTNKHMIRTTGNISLLNPPNYIDIYNNQPSYYIQTSYQSNDYIGQRILNDTDNEPTFTASIAYLAPQRDYGMIGSIVPYQKYSVSPDGRIKTANGAIYTPTMNRTETQPGTLVFDPADYLPYWPDTNWTYTKSGLMGNYLRIISTIGYDTYTRYGFEQLAIVPASDPSNSVLVRLYFSNGTVPSYSPDSLRLYRYYNVSVDYPAVPLDDTVFYRAVFAEQDLWTRTFGNGTLITLPHMEGQRQIDSVYGGIVNSLSLYVNLAPNYGDGQDYWAPNSSLTSNVAPVDISLLELGLFSFAADRVGFYFTVFINPDGSLSECTPCVDNQEGFGDALADYGETLDLFVRTANYQLAYNSSGTVWVNQYLPPFIALLNYTFRLRMNATVNGTLPGEVTHGLIYGSPEHDTCHEPDYYYHNNAWILRGLMQATQFLLQYNGSGIPLAYTELAQRIAQDVPVFQQDIDASIRLATVPLSGNGTNGSSSNISYWIPPVASVNSTPFESMTESILASYTNFRYWAELLNADIFMPNRTTAVQIMNFRENRAGTIAGITRYTDHLDNMPSFGYAWAALHYDRFESFWLLVYNHMANYQGRGVFTATEQVPYLTDSLGYWRDYLWTYLEGGIDMCVPSAMLVPLATRWSLVFEHFDYDTLWLAKGAPRRWYANNDNEEKEDMNDTGGFTITNAPTRFGTISYVVNPVATISSTRMNVTMMIEYASPPYRAPLFVTDENNVLTVITKLRAPNPAYVLSGIDFVTSNTTIVTFQSFNPTEETVTFTIEIGRRIHSPVYRINIEGSFVESR